MIACGVDANGKDEAVVYSGEARWDGNVLTVARRPPDASFELQPEWIGRIKPVAEELRETLLGAAYCFSVTIGSLPKDALEAEYQKLGIRWSPNVAS